MSAFLVTYRPLAVSAHGRRVASSFSLPPFIDASCRREPDLESRYPSISALCRVNQFAPRLHNGDEILYITVKSAFGQSTEPHYRAVAHLQVRTRFPSHTAAADWYKNQGCPTPSNCMISSNPPVPYNQTGANPGRNASACSTAANLRAWDRTYRQRSQNVGVFLACEPLWLELHHPPKLLVSDIVAVFGHVPGTRTPPEISIPDIRNLLQRARQHEAQPLDQMLGTISSANP